MARKSNTGGESIAGYFRKVFEDNPGWLKERSNDKLLQKWLADHPGAQVPFQTPRRNKDAVEAPRYFNPVRCALQVQIARPRFRRRVHQFLEHIGGASRISRIGSRGGSG